MGNIVTLIYHSEYLVAIFYSIQRRGTHHIGLEPTDIIAFTDQHCSDVFSSIYSFLKYILGCLICNCSNLSFDGVTLSYVRIRQAVLTPLTPDYGKLIMQKQFNVFRSILDSISSND